MNMESESKIEVKEGLENPEVGRNLGADETSDQATNGNDPELSTDSPTEFGLRDAPGYELAMPRDCNMESKVNEGNGNHLIATEPVEGDIAEIVSPSSSKSPFVRTDEPKIINTETAESAPVITTLPVEADVPEKTHHSLCEDDIMKSKVTFPESSDSIIRPVEPNCNAERRNPGVVVVASDRVDRVETSSVMSTVSEGAIQPTELSMKTEVFQCGDKISEVNVVNLATTESSDDTIIPRELNSDEECQHSVVADVTSETTNLSETECVVTSFDAAVLPAEVPTKTDVSVHRQEDITVPNSPAESGNYSGCIEERTDLGRLSSLNVDATPDVLSVEAVPSTAENAKPSIRKVNITQLKRFYQWCNQGLSSGEALAKAMDSELEPQNVDPHPNCKFPLEEIEKISMLIPAGRCRRRFKVETFFGGKEPEEQLKISLALTNTKRHPHCKHSWVDLMNMCRKLPKESLRLKFVVETYCGGKEPEKVMKAVSSAVSIEDDTVSDGLSHLIGKQITTYNKSRAAGSSSSATLLQSKSPGHVPQVAMIANPVNEETVDSIRERVLDESPSETTEISKLSLSQMNKYYRWRILGIDYSEAILKAKEPGLLPPTEDPRTLCKLPFKEIKEISFLLPPKHPRIKFQVETFFGGKDPEEQLKLMLSNLNTERHPDCVYSWEALKEMSKELPKESLRLKFVVETYCRGKKPDEFLQAMLPSTDKISKDSVDEQNVVGAAHEKLSGESEISKLSVNQLEKYYKWCILGTDPSEAIIKAKETRLIPQTENPHPNCKLPWEDIKQLSVFIPAKNPRSKFQVETYFGGKNPEEQLKLALSNSNTKRHPDCTHSWDDLKKMSNKLPQESSRLKFIVEAFHGGKEPAELLKTMLSNDPNVADNTRDSRFVDVSVGRAAGAKELDSAYGSVDVVAKDVSPKKPEDAYAEKPGSDLYRNCTIIDDVNLENIYKLKSYYLWRNKGYDHETALKKVRKNKTIPHPDLPHPNCQYTKDQLLLMSQPLKGENTYVWDRFLILTYYGGKNPESTLQYFMSRLSEAHKPGAVLAPQPEDVSAKKPDNISAKKPEGLSAKKPEDVSAKKPEDVSAKKPEDVSAKKPGYVFDKKPEDVSAKKQESDSAKKPQDVSDRKPVVTIIEEGSICGLPNYQLKYFYLWHNGGFDDEYALSKARKFETYTGKHLPHPECKLSQEELKKMSQALKSNTYVWDRFLILTYYGGKDPETTLQYFISRLGKGYKSGAVLVPQPEDVSAEKPDGISTKKPENVSAKKPEYVSAKKPEGVSAKKPEDVSVKKPEDVSAEKPGYVSDKKPEDVSAKKQENDSAKKPEDVSDRKPVVAIIEEGSICGLPNYQLKYFYLWRNGGFDDEYALSKAHKFETYTGKHLPHPECKLSQEELKKMSQALKSNTCVWDRFVILTYYGGKDPETTLRYFISHLGKAYKPGAVLVPQAEDVSAQKPDGISTKKPENVSAKKPEDVPAKKPENDSAEKPEGIFAKKPEKDSTKKPVDVTAKEPEGGIIEEGAIRDLPNCQLKYFYLWRNGGFDNEYALSKACKFVNYTGKHVPHPECKLSQVELKKMSHALKSNTYIWDRFIILTYYGGQVPDSTLQYFMSRLGKSYKPGALLATQPEDISAKKPEDISAKKLKYVHGKMPEHVSAKKPEYASAKKPKDVSAKKPEDISAKKRQDVSAKKPEDMSAKKRQDVSAMKPKDVSAEKLGTDLGRNCSIFDNVNLDNGRLKYYYLWRNKGYDHDTSLSKLRTNESFPDTHLPHPSCQYTTDQLKLMSQSLKSSTFVWDRFLILTYYGGKDPASTLEYLMPAKAGKPKDVTAVKPESASDRDLAIIEDLNLASGKLKYYYLWRNKGYDHETALSKVRILATFPGAHFPHPNCQYTKDHLLQILQPSSLDTISRDRFLIHTYFGGKDPECTMRYFKSRSEKGNEPEDVSAKKPEDVSAKKPEDVSAKKLRNHLYSIIDNVNLDNGKLEYYYLWRNKGCDHATSLSKLKINETFPGTHLPHPNCKFTTDQLKQMSQALESNRYFWRRFVILTYYGGKDPESTLKHFMSRLGKAYKPGAVLAVRSVKHITVLDTIIVNNDNLKSYYLWRNRGFNHETALSKIANQETVNVKSRNVPHHKCKHSQYKLRRISQALKSIPYVWDRFLIHTYYGGEDPEDTLRYYMAQSKKEDESKDIVAGNPQQARKIPGSAHPLPSEPVAKRARSFLDSGIIPVDSPNHPSRELDDHQLACRLSEPTIIEEAPLSELPNDKLEYYYLWRNGGFNHQYALTKARNSFCYISKHIPHPRCKLSQEELEKWSQALSHDTNSRDRFLIHTYFGGKDPECTLRYFMARLSQQQQQQPQKCLYNLRKNPPNGEYKPPHGPSQAAGLPAVEPPHQHPAVSLPQPIMPPYQPSAVRLSHASSPPYQHETASLPTAAQTYVTAGAVVYPPYQQPVPGSPNMLYPPNQPQTTLPFMSHPTPQASMAYSGYPHAALVPPIVAYPPNQPQGTIQPPLPLEPPPRKEEKPPEKDGSTPMFIVPTSYPTECLTESQMDAIESSLLEALLEMDDDGTKPSFTDTCRSNGRYGITCIDQFSVNWLHKFLSTYQPWSGASLKLVSKQGKMTRANAILPSSKGDDDKKILKFIERQNKELNVNLWTLIQRWDNEDFNTCMDFDIDEESAVVLQKCSRISFKLGSAEIITAENDSPPVSRLGHQNIAGKLADSLQTQAPMTSLPPPPSGPPLRSSPPTPKCMGPGEDYPRPPKSPGKTDGSPLRSSACPVPSQDRFGSPVSTTHSSKPPLQEHSRSGPSSTSPDDAGEGKHSWLDWFYSKEEHGVPRKHKSRSPSRGRSSSPDTSCKAKRTRRDRRRSDSMSLSPECRRSAPRTPSPDRYGRKSSDSKKKKRTASRSPSFSRHRKLDSRQRGKYSRYR